MVVTLGISPVAARKRVSRLAGNVRCLGYITFPRKARYMYLEQQFGSPQYWENLGSGLVLSQSQKITVAASAIAEKKVRGQRS
ncbi:hypothetical protein GCM10011319_52910 [Mameliella alba]|nr:hypothetical protein GCM10011319_52910 [Mameliella alba]